MSDNAVVHYIPARFPKREKRVGIYCRVSTNSMEQLQSLTVQISHLTRVVSTMPQWLLSDVYIDIASSKTGSSRKEFSRLLEDCNSKKIDIVITKNISRFGRDSVEVLDAFNNLKALGVRVIFEQEDLDTANTDCNLMVSIIESLAQAENESRSDNIRMGIKYRASSGTSKLYDRKCYGYKHNEEGKLIIDDETSKNVKLIFELYLGGQSVLGIVKELEKRKILSPTGKEKWCKRTIDVMLSNEKYMGNLLLQKTCTPDFLTGKQKKNCGEQSMFLVENAHEPIVSKEIFEDVQRRKHKM